MMRRRGRPSFAAGVLASCVLVPACADDQEQTERASVVETSAPARGAPRPGESLWLPTGVQVTPTMTPGSRFTDLDPELAAFPQFRAGQAVALATSPDARTLLVLTSGYNRNVGRDASASISSPTIPGAPVAANRISPRSSARW